MGHFTAANKDPKLKATLVGVTSASVGEKPAVTNAKAKGKPESQLSAFTEKDQAAIASAASIIEKDKPALLIVGLESLDYAQEQFGSTSKEASATVSLLDGWLKKINEAVKRAGTTDETTFLIAAPFGFAPVESEFSPNVVLAKKGFLTTDSQGKITSWRAIAQSFGGAAAIITKDPEDEKTASEAEAVFREIHEKPYSPVWRIISRREISRLGADARVAFYLEAAPGYKMSERSKGETKTKSEMRGTHGYLPQRFEMRGAFIATGKGIKPGAKIEYSRLIDLAPTIARLLGFELKTTRGRVLSEILSQ